MDRFRRRVSADENLSRLERALSGLTTSRRPSPARTESDEDTSSGETFKGPLGLNLLRDVTEPAIDFIFVHGLGGGSRKSWSKSPNQYHFWPKEWLSQDPEFSCVRIHSFGYKADWNERKESVLDIHDFARSLLGQIENSPDIRRSNTKLVFVAHSMGGLVVKKAYILAREDPLLKAVAKRIHSLYFLATPHRGSDLTKTLTNIMKVSYGQKAFVSELERDSGSISAINDSFRHFAEDVQLWSFYETVPSNLVLTTAIIVDKSSATLGYARERSSLLNADHRGVCKFDIPSDANYKTLRNAFITTVDGILSESIATHNVSQTTSRASRMQHEQLIELTGISEPPVNDLMTLEDTRAVDSCQWMLSKQIYASWRTPWSESPPVLWLTGNAGCGKSVLCSQIINDLQQHNLRCSYFFFKHGNSAESTVASCLRALAYQMAKSDEAILRKVLAIEQDALPCAQWDERTIWRKLFIGCIFDVSKPLPQFWVIDALDECQKFRQFSNLLAKAPSYLRVFITSRSTSEVDQCLTSLGPLVTRYQIRNEDTLGDLGIYIDSKMDRLPAADEAGQAILKRRLLEKSSGSFLWVTLIVQELQQAYSEEAAEEILNEVPEDMNNLFTRMLESLPANERSMTLARSVFMWTLFCVRALTLGEMQCAIKLDTNQTVHNLEKSVPAICGHLVAVDQHQRVHTIHETVQAFLLAQDVYPKLAMNRQECHTRIAQACLKFLAGTQPQGARVRHPPMKQVALTPETKIMEYASMFFSDHLQKCSSEEAITWDILCMFLDSNLLTWIELLARRGKLYHVTRTAKNLRGYLMRRLKYVHPLSRGRDRLESWIDDMIKVSAKFRMALSISPSSIQSLIPQMCPSESILAQTYASRYRGFCIMGLRNKCWDDCLARIDFSGKQTSAVDIGDRYLSIALSDGTIYLYYRESVQVRAIFTHGERIKAISLSSDCLILASCGVKNLKIWDTESKTQSWVFDLTHQILAMQFVHENVSLVAATQNNHHILWNLKDGCETERWKWTDSVRDKHEHSKLSRPPSKIAMSLLKNMLAVSHRGLPIHLFDTQSRTLIGSCGRPAGGHGPTTSHQYPVEALAFNPSPEIDILVASYGDGELVTFDLFTCKLRQRISDVFAQNITCSPDGRTLVSGNSQGAIQIFEFGGADGEKLSHIHRIDAHDDSIRSIVFSSDSLRFADIHGSQCRIWEPAVLIRSDAEEGSQSEISQAVTLVPKSVGVLDVSQDAEITCLCYDHTHNFVFCGKLDGTVVVFETESATQQRILYRHAANIRVTRIAYSEQNHTLITIDESGRVLLKMTIMSTTTYESTSTLAELRFDGIVTRLLLNPPNTALLLQGKQHAEIWNLKGQKVGSPLRLNAEDSRIMFNDPNSYDNFIVFDNESMLTYSWADGLEVRQSSTEQIGSMSLQVIPPSPLQPRIPSSAFPPPNRRLVKFIAALSKDTSRASSHSSTDPRLKVWPATTIPNSSTNPPPKPLPDSDDIAPRIRQIIAVDADQFFFLDTDYWVCSLDLSTMELSAQNVTRHFFLLSEWQSSGGGFLIDYSSSKREFVLATKDSILVFRRGLDFAEPWAMS